MAFDEKDAREYIGCMAKIMVVPFLKADIPVSYSNQANVKFLFAPTKGEIQALIAHLAMIAKSAPDEKPKTIEEIFNDNLNRFLSGGKDDA